MHVIELEYWGTLFFWWVFGLLDLKICFKCLQVMFSKASHPFPHALPWDDESPHAATLGFSPRTLIFVFFLDILMSHSGLHKSNLTSGVQLTVHYCSLLTQADTELCPRVDWALCHHSVAQFKVDSQSEYADSKTILTLSHPVSFQSPRAFVHAVSGSR